MKSLFRLNSFLLFLIISLPSISFITMLFMYASDKKLVETILPFHISVLTDICISVQLLFLLFWSATTLLKMDNSTIGKALKWLVMVSSFILYNILYISTNKAKYTARLKLLDSSQLKEIGTFKGYILADIINIKTNVYLFLLVALIVSYIIISVQLKKKFANGSILSNFIRMLLTPLTIRIQKNALNNNPK